MNKFLKCVLSLLLVVSAACNKPPEIIMPGEISISDILRPDSLTQAALNIRDALMVPAWNQDYPRVDAAEAYQYALIIVRYAREHSLSPKLIAAIVKAESWVNKHAISSAGAVGLMQILPRTWKDVFPECGTDLYDPTTNICYGVSVFLVHLEECSNNIPCALRDYSGHARNYVRRVLDHVETID